MENEIAVRHGHRLGVYEYDRHPHLVSPLSALALCGKQPIALVLEKGTAAYGVICGDCRADVRTPRRTPRATTKTKGAEDEVAILEGCLVAAVEGDDHPHMVSSETRRTLCGKQPIALVIEEGMTAYSDIICGDCGAALPAAH